MDPLAQRKTPKLATEPAEPAPANIDAAEPVRAPLKLSKKVIQVDNPRTVGPDPNSVDRALERNLQREQFSSQADYAEDHRRVQAFIWRKRRNALAVVLVLGAVNGAVWYVLHRSGAGPLAAIAAAILGGGFTVGVLLYLWVR